MINGNLLNEGLIGSGTVTEVVTTPAPSADGINSSPIGVPTNAPLNAGGIGGKGINTAPTAGGGAAYPAMGEGTFIVSADLATLYALKVANDLTVPIPLVVAGQLQVVQAIKVSTQLSVPYTSLADITPVPFSSPYDIRNTTDVANDLATSYAAKVAADLASSYDAMAQVAANLGILYSLMGVIANDLTVDYDGTNPVAGDMAVKYDLTPLNKVVTDLKVQLSYSNETVVIATGVPTMTHNGRLVAITEASISSSESDVGWRGSITLAEQADYALITTGDTVVVDYFGEIYTFIVASKNLSRTHGNIRMSLVCDSPAVQYSGKYATSITKVWEVDVMASAIADEVIPAGVAWNTVDWLIPAFRMGIADGSPLDIVKRLASAVGAVVDADMTGALIVRPKYPVPMNTLGTAALDHTYTDDADNLSVEEDFAYTKRVDQFRISDSGAGYADTIEFVPDLVRQNEGEVRVYLSPWRTNYIVRHTKLAGFTLTGGVETVETITETIQVLAGVARTSKPILGLVSVISLDIDLGGYTFVIGDREVHAVVAGESLITLTYEARYMQYAAVGTIGDMAQILVEAV